MSVAPSGLPRLLAGLHPDGSAMTLFEHERTHGPIPQISPGELIDVVARSGLRGRGGADFPTAIKLGAVAERRGSRALIVNATESEPASGKDEMLLSRLPHLVLDGAILAAGAVGASEAIVQVGFDAPEAWTGVSAAVESRNTDRVPVHVVRAPPGYVAGEESAVVNHLNGGRAKPSLVPPRPYERGYHRRPTLLNNPETLAQIALVARYGAGWYRELGTSADPGSALVTISGAVATPGVYELAFGTPLTDLLGAADGPTEPLQALLVGGYFGTWVQAARAMQLRLAREDLRSVGCTLGAGVLIALGESSCGLHESARVIDYLAHQSAGQCGPCVHGLRAIADAVSGLTRGRADRHELDRIARWSSEVKGRGACHHPDGATRFVESALRVFHDDIAWHRSEGCTAPPAGLPLGAAPEHRLTAATGARR